MKKHYLPVFIFITFLIFSCIEELIPPLDNIPVLPANTGIALNSKVISSADSVRITVNATDTEQDSLMYTYSAVAGSFKLKSTERIDTNVIWWYPSGLKDGNYYVKVKVEEKKILLDPAKYADYKGVMDSVLIQVHSDKETPLQPINVFPANESKKNGVNITLKWSFTKTDSDQKFQVYLSKDKSALTEITTKAIKADSLTLSAILEYNTTYFWKVRSSYASGKFKESVITSFTTRNRSTEAVPADIKFITVPKGTYKLGKNDKETQLKNDFQIMQNEVTNQQFVNFLNVMKDNKEIYVENGLAKGFYDGDQYVSADTNFVFARVDTMITVNKGDGKFSVKTGFENYPVRYVSWYGANAFAKHYNLELPARNEWEMAARGNRGFDYINEDNLFMTYANVTDSTSLKSTEVKDTVLSNFGTVVPVGSYNGSALTHKSEHTGNNVTVQTIAYFSDPSGNNNNANGIFDLIGNVAEWTSDIKQASRFTAGGSYLIRKEAAKSWMFYNYPIGSTLKTIGFRCVKK